MGIRNRAILLTAAAATAFTLFGSLPTADADSRRHVVKPGDTSADVTRDDSPGAGAPEINGTTLTLGLSLVAGAIAVLAGRRRSSPRS